MRSPPRVHHALCRGKFRSKPWQALLDEAKHLVDSGVVELNLIAEDTNQYGMDRWVTDTSQHNRAEAE